MTVLEKILLFWVLLFLTPKLVFVPVFRAMYRAMAATDRQDELDREWLDAYERRQRGDDDLRRRRRRPRGPRPTRPRRPGDPSPSRQGQAALHHRHTRRRPLRAVSR